MLRVVHPFRVSRAWSFTVSCNNILKIESSYESVLLEIWVNVQGPILLWDPVWANLFDKLQTCPACRVSIVASLKLRACPYWRWWLCYCQLGYSYPYLTFEFSVLVWMSGLLTQCYNSCIACLIVRNFIPIINGK